jgi:hypothetical protein
MSSTQAAGDGAVENAGLTVPWAFVLVAVGIACGFATHLSIELADSLAWKIGPSLALTVGGLAFCLAVDPRRALPGAAAAIVLALFLGLLSTTAMLRFGPAIESSTIGHSIALAVEALIIAQITVPFLQTWQEQRRLAFPYERLFAHAWNNSLTVALSAAFTGLFWLILWLFALLFRYVGFDQLERLIGESAFAWPASAAAAALGIYAGRDYRRIVIALRRIVFGLFSVLTPLYLALSLVFALALAAGGFAKLSAVTSATATLIALLVIGIVLFNAVLRDGTPEAEAGRWLQRCAVLLAPALLALCGFAAYGIYLRVQQYGLTPERVWVVAIVAVLALHCLAYVAALAARSRWTTTSRRANTGVAAVVALIAVLLQTPIADPDRLSAESQYRRLVSGIANAETFDYGFLKFRLGSAGTEVLERLATDSGLAPREVVEGKLANLRSQTNYWEWQAEKRGQALALQGQTLRDPDVVLRVPADLALPEDLGSEAVTRRLWLRNCSRRPPKTCLITASDITDSPGDEYLFAMIDARNNVTLFLLEKPAGEWRVVHLGFHEQGAPIFTALRAGRREVIPADHRDLRIGDNVIRLRAPNSPTE